MSPVTTETPPPGWGLGPTPPYTVIYTGNYTITADATEFSPLAKLETMRKATGETSVRAVTEAAKKRK